MKYMKLGTRPDTFFTQEATRSVSSDVPSDLTIQINNTTYLLHKCGLLQRLCSDGGDSDNCTIELHEIPGGEEAFELCAKFSYGIMINLSAHNFVAAICAAKFLRMTESIEKGNFILKLEAFFDSCILQGWKDSIMALQTTGKLPEWSENIGILGRCVDAIVEKILTPLSKVGRLIDSYLQVVARDANVPASKIIALAESLPEFARPKHDDLYKAIDIYLKDHPDLIKSEKKRLCRILDCQKLSPDVCMHAVKNERLPLRTVVQVLFLEQERATRPNNRNPPHDHAMSGVLSSAGGHGEIEESIEEAKVPGPNRRDPKKTQKPDTKMPEQAQPNGSKRTVGRKHVMEMDKGREIIEEGGLDGSLGPKKVEIKGRSTVGRGPKAGHKYD